MKFSVEERKRNVHNVNVEGWRVDDRFSTFWCADVHWDNPKCDRDMFRRHLEKCKKERIPVFIVGDFFCAMQGKYDRRSDKSSVRPEHQKNDYLDALVQTAADWLAPYSEVIMVIGDGNHETSIKKHCETDLLARLCQLIKYKTGNSVYHGGYGGHVRMIFKRGGSHQGSIRKLIKYFHGSGGGGPVTKGVIQTNRRAVFSNADVIVTGHIHEEWELTTMRERLRNNDELELVEQLHICLPTYKEEYNKGKGGWHVERGAAPKPLGGKFIHFDFTNDGVQVITERAK